MQRSPGACLLSSNSAAWTTTLSRPLGRSAALDFLASISWPMLAVAHVVSYSCVTIASMKAVEYWLWMMKDCRGAVRQSPCRFTVTDALQRDPDAVRIPGSCIVRNLPVTPEEFDAQCTSAFLRKSSGFHRSG